jgi:hypothetical protein
MWGWLLKLGLGPLLGTVADFILRILEREELKQQGRMEVQNAQLKRRLEDVQKAQQARRDADRAIWDVLAKSENQPVMSV